MCPALSASCPFPRPPEIRFTQTALTNPFWESHIVKCTGFTQSKSAEIKTRKLLLVGNVEGSVEDSS